MNFKMNKTFLMFGLLSVFLLATCSGVSAWNYTSRATSNYGEAINTLSLKLVNGTTTRTVTTTGGTLATMIANGTVAAKKKYNLTFYDNNYFTNRTYTNYNYSASGNLTATLTYRHANYSVFANSDYYGSMTGFVVNFRNGSTSRNFTAPHYEVSVITPMNTRRYNITVYSDDHTPKTYTNYQFLVSGNLTAQLTHVESSGSDSCLGVKAIMYGAFALFAVGLIVIAALALMNSDISVSLVVLVLGLAIAIIIGYVVTSYLADTVCFIA